MSDEQSDESDVRVEIRLTADEALVLSQWIYQLEEANVPLGDQAVWLALYRIGGVLETTLVEIFSPNYDDMLEAARRRLLRKMGVEGHDDISGDPG